MTKLGARDRAQLVVLAYKNGLVSLRSPARPEQVVRSGGGTRKPRCRRADEAARARDCAPRGLVPAPR